MNQTKKKMENQIMLKYLMGFIALLTTALITTVSLSGCGNGADPLSLFSNPTPKLDQIVASPSGLGANLLGGFNSNTPYWTFSSGGVFGGNYYSPQAGVVAEVGTSSQFGVTSWVRILHSGRIATVLYGLQYVSVQPGAAVLDQQVIGAFFGSGNVIFQVLLDGTPVCPLSYLSDAFRAKIGLFSTGWGVTPCY